MITLPPELEHLASFTREIMGIAQWFLGGIFGLYVIFIIFKIVEHRKLTKRLERIEKKIDKLAKHK